MRSEQYKTHQLIGRHLLATGGDGAVAAPRAPSELPALPPGSCLETITAGSQLIMPFAEVWSAVLAENATFAPLVS